MEAFTLVRQMETEKLLKGNVLICLGINAESVSYHFW